MMNVSGIFNFEGARSFYADITGRDVSNVMNVKEIFKEAKEFKGNLSSWDVSKVTTMFVIFEGTSALGGAGLEEWWNISSVTNIT